MPAVNEISIMIHVVWVVKFLLKKTLQHRMFGYAAEFKPGVVQRGVLEFALLCNDQLTRPKDNKQQQNLPVCC